MTGMIGSCSSLSVHGLRMKLKLSLHALQVVEQCEPVGFFGDVPVTAFGPSQRFDSRVCVGRT